MLQFVGERDLRGLARQLFDGLAYGFKYHTGKQTQRQTRDRQGRKRRNLSRKPAKASNLGRANRKASRPPPANPISPDKVNRTIPPTAAAETRSPVTWRR